jgi:hypothetical protein
VDVIEDSPLLSEFTLQIRFVGIGLLELFSKIVVGLLEVLADPSLTTDGFPYHEAEGMRCGQARAASSAALYKKLLRTRDREADV